MTGHRLHKEKPVAFLIMQHNIGHLAMLLNLYAEPSEKCLLKVSPFFTSISGIDQDGPWCESRIDAVDLGSGG